MDSVIRKIQTFVFPGRSIQAVENRFPLKQRTTFHVTILENLQRSGEVNMIYETVAEAKINQGKSVGLRLGARNGELLPSDIVMVR